jgi:hypothetical protein
VIFERQLGAPLSQELLVEFARPIHVVLRTDNEPAGGSLNLDDSSFRIDGPIDQDRVVSALCRQAEHAIISKGDALTLPP